MAEDLGVLRVSLGLDNSQFTGSVRQINARLNALNAEFRATSSGVEGFEQSLEGMRAKSQNLTQVLDLQRDKARRLREEYRQAAATYGENSAQAQRLSARYNSVIAVINRTQTQLNQLNSEIELQENRWHQLSQRLNETSDDLREFGENAKNTGSQLSVGLTTPIVAAGVAVGMVAAQFEDAQVKIQNSLGVSSEEAEKFADVAQNIWADGFGEDLNTVSDALIKVKQNIKGISDEAELEKVTRDAIILAETFDSDVNEVTRAGQNLMQNFGISSDVAFNLMATGAQKGLNFSQEMFDNLSEYSGLFAKMGFSADEYFQLLVNGSQAGVYNLDYINDVMKEFQIRVKDGSKTTSDAMGQMSESTQKVWKEFLKGNGTVKDVSNVVLSELKSMDDQVAANNIGVGLYGTKWEDLEADAMYSLTTIGDEMSNVTGAMDKMAKAQEQTFSQRWQSLLREAQQKLEPIGKEVLNIAEDFLPKLASGLDKVVGWFSDLDDEGQNVVLTLVGVAAAAGPLLMGGGLIASGASSVVSLASSFASAAAKGGLLTTALGAISGPVGWAVLGTTAVVGLGAAIVNLSKDSETTTEEMLKLQEETFNTAMASYDAAQKNVELANSYDGLRDKSSLTVEELLRFKEIQKELENTTSSEKVSALKDELANLQEKSGLTSDELSRMLELDQQIIDTVPGVESAYDSKGNAVIKYSDAVKEVTQAQLELQKAEAMTTLTEAIDGLDEQISKLGELQESYVSLSETKTTLEQQALSINQELVQLEQDRLTAKSQGLQFDEQAIDVHSRQREISLELKDIDDQRKGASEAQLKILDEQEATLFSEREILNGSNGELMTREEYLKESLRLIGDELDTAKESLNNTSQEKALIEEKLALSKLQYNQILNTLAEEVGVTAEEGKQLEAMRSQYDKNAEIISQLQTQKGTAEGLTAEEQNRLEELIKQNNQIGNNIEEAELLNSTLSEDIKKQLDINDGGQVDAINRELSLPITKRVRIITEGGDVITGAAGGRIPQYAVGTNNHPGGLAIVGEKGPELGILPSGQRVMLGLEGAQMVGLPKGSKVLTNDKTESLLNVRWFASGGIMTGPTIFGQMGNTILGGGEAGPEAILPLNGFYKNLDSLFKNYLDRSGTTINVNAEPTAKAIAREVERSQRKVLFGI
ncbi:TPA: phage tail tape measure protein [Salmonella enterica subsp. enterica serovar Typhi str. AG3]|nr:phage tail tape measure protein [Salmonella enterica subsp. enterica serovar Typhi str. AG3]